MTKLVRRVALLVAVVAGLASGAGCSKTIQSASATAYSR